MTENRPCGWNEDDYVNGSKIGKFRLSPIYQCWLMDHDCVPQHGDFILHQDGSWSNSKGDEDVLETIDGTGRIITRSFQNWHTHLPMILNRGMGEGLPLMEWLETAIFPVEKKLTADLIRVGTCLLYTSPSPRDRG